MKQRPDPNRDWPVGASRSFAFLREHSELPGINWIVELPESSADHGLTPAEMVERVEREERK